MSVRLVAFAAIWLMIVVIAVQFPSIWSGERLYNVIKRVRGLTPFGDQALLVMLRGFLLIVVAVAALLASITVVEVDRMTVGSLVPAAVTGGLLWIGMGLLAAGVLVGILGWPPFMIPPSIRGCRTLDDVFQRANRNV